MNTTASNQQDRPDDAAIEFDVSDEQRDRAVLDLILCDSLGAPWSTDELVRTIGDRIGTLDSVARLQGDGLVHRLGEFVFPTLAARRADQLATEAI